MKVLGVLLLVVVGVSLLVALRRMFAPSDSPESPGPAVRRSREGGSLALGQKIAPFCIALIGWAGVTLAMTTPWWFGVSVAVLLGAISGVWIRYAVARSLATFESQLSGGIDLMVSTLRAGGGLTDALNGAAKEADRNFGRLLAELIERIRLGDPPGEVLQDLEDRVDLESFRLFSFTLRAHWEGGGSLATTLSDVGRTIRDRVDVARRVRSQAVETQASVLGILVVTYGLALLMWSNYPERMETFTGSELGSMFVALTIFLQGIGLLWITRISRVEV